MDLSQQVSSQPILKNLGTKDILKIKKDFGLTETELAYLLSLGKRYQKNEMSLVRKLILN